MSDGADITIRDARADDLPAIIAMIADDQLGRTRDDASIPLDARYTRAFEAIERDPGNRLLVAERNGRVVGTLQLTFIPGLARTGAWRGQIEAVRIARDERGGGLGRRLMDWAIETCRARGCTLVQLTSDRARPEAHRFYESIGFVASHEGFKLAIDVTGT